MNLAFFFLWKTKSTQILIDPSKGIFVNNDWISKDPKNKFGGQETGQEFLYKMKRNLWQRIH